MQKSPQKIIFFIVLLISVTFFKWGNSNINWAKENIKQVEQLAKDEKNFDAYDLAVKIESYLPNDADLAKLMPTISDKLSVNSEPTGAKVYLKQFRPDEKGNFPERQNAKANSQWGLR